MPKGGPDGNDPNEGDEVLNFVREPERDSICSTADTSHISIIDIPNDLQNRPREPIAVLHENND